MQQPIEGMTRTSRRTGEVQAFRGGTWVTVQPGSSAPAAPGIVQVAPAQPRPETPPSGFRPTPDGGLTPIPGGPADPNARPTDPPAGFRFGPNGQLEAIPGGPADPTRPGSAPGTEGERTAAFLTQRVAGGIQDMMGALAEEPGAERPSITATVAGIFGNDARNWANSAARQRVEAAQLDILDAALTLGTGASYTPEQIENYRQSYFPGLTDAPGTVADKQRRLLRLLEAARVKAGAAGEHLDPIIEQLTQLAQRQAAGQPDIEDGIPHVGSVGRGSVPAQPPPPPQGLGERLIDSTVNTLAGVGQGVAAIPDIAATALGNTLAIPVDALGFEETADQLRNPFTIGGAIEDAAPTPDDFASRAVRFGAQFTGGAASLPRQATNALTNAIVGRVPPSIPPGGGNALSATINGQQANPQQVGAAAARLSQATGSRVRMMPADVGGPTARFVSAGTSRSLGGIPMARAAEESVGSVQGARNALAGRAGSASDEAGAGRAARRGVESFIADETPVTRLYNRIPIRDDAPAQLTGTRAALANLSNPIRSNRDLSELVADPKFAAWQRALAQNGDGAGNLSWWDLKEFRTLIGRRISDGADGSSDLRHLYSALTSDMEATARAAGPQAFRAFTRANNFARGRADRIESVLRPLLGGRRERSGEQIYQELNRMAQARGGNARDLGRVLRSMPADERGEVAATIISRMGMVRPETPGAVGEVFSPAVWARQWGNVSERARASLFPDGRLRSALNDLAIVTNGMNRAQQFTNFSNSATTGNFLALLGLTSVGDLGTSAAAAGAQYGLGMVMARDVMSSPRYVRWLTQAARLAQTGSPTALRQHVNRLPAGGTPALQQLQQQLIAALETSPATRAAADQNEQVGQEVPNQGQ